MDTEQTLADRVFVYKDCGSVLDRDENAATNILTATNSSQNTSYVSTATPGYIRMLPMPVRRRLCQPRELAAARGAGDKGSALLPLQ